MFNIGTEYTHASIVSAFGGDPVSYLPQVAGQIVCGRFKAGEMNPRAPYAVVVGDLPQVKRKASILASQGGAIPVFMKEGSNRWRYHGLMRCGGYDTDERSIVGAAGSNLRDTPVAGILRMLDVEKSAVSEATKGESSRIDLESVAPRHIESRKLLNEAPSRPPSTSLLIRAMRGTLMSAAWIVGLGGAAAAGSIVGIGGLFVGIIKGRRRPYRRSIW